ncbi:MAG: nucleoside-triphosphatase [Tissierellia bacterium]|nr:nucleoside-triphosphatase [Tissierellia bacterium]
MKPIPLLLEALKKSHTNRHLVLTGSVGRGKSTLLQAYLKELPPAYVVRTHVDKEHRHIWAQLPSGTIIELAYFDRGFHAYEEGFFQLLTAMKKESVGYERIVIDEVGHVETQVPSYIEEILNLSKEKTMIYVVRKDRSPFWDRIDALQDHSLFDLDHCY